MNNYKRITKRTTGGKVCIPFNNEFYITQAYERLAELEDKLESGLLLDLPCKVGDTLYRICPQGAHIKYGEMWDGKIVQRPCQRCPWEGCGCYDIGYQKDMKEHIVQPREMKNLAAIVQIIPYLGKIWFTTKEQAEARLKELQGDKQ